MPNWTPTLTPTASRSPTSRWTTSNNARYVATTSTANGTTRSFHNALTTRNKSACYLLTSPNAAFAEMLGFDPEEVLSLRFHEDLLPGPGVGIPAFGLPCAREHGRRIGSQGRFGRASFDEQVGSQARGRSLRPRGVPGSH